MRGRSCALLGLTTGIDEDREVDAAAATLEDIVVVSRSTSDRLERPVRRPRDEISPWVDMVAVQPFEVASDEGAVVVTQQARNEASIGARNCFRFGWTKKRSKVLINQGCLIRTCDDRVERRINHVEGSR